MRYVLCSLFYWLGFVDFSGRVRTCHVSNQSEGQKLWLQPMKADCWGRARHWVIGFCCYKPWQWRWEEKDERLMSRRKTIWFEFLNVLLRIFSVINQAWWSLAGAKTGGLIRRRNEDWEYIISFKCRYGRYISVLVSVNIKIIYDDITRV